MISWRVSDSAEAIRGELRAWLVDHPPPTANRDSSLESFVTVGREWQRQLAKGRWLGLHWPVEFGGRGLTLVEEAVVQEELGRVGSPQVLGLFGLTMVGPVLIAHGTDTQRRRFLGSILSGKEIWCQGFSEPGAGSDLTAVSLKCESVVDPMRGEGFRLNGSKIWTSFAHIADWCFLLGRTGRGERPHDGLSYLLVDMKSPGVTVRPLRQISGEEEFNEVFFDGVFVPREHLVGEVGKGWSIALTTLLYERVVLTFARHVQSERVLQELLSPVWQARMSDSDRAELATHVATFNAIRALAYHHVASYAGGGSPGPEGSIDKLLWSESFQQLADFRLRLEGVNAIISEADSAHSLRYLYSRGRTIAAGTSEIQRSIIAERLLGLPRLVVGPRRHNPVTRNETG
jgi:alkylation response protein AidB-like acyl-CoA dehydrogenase